MSLLYYFNIVHHNQKIWKDIKAALKEIEGVRKMYNDSHHMGSPDNPKPKIFNPKDVPKALQDYEKEDKICDIYNNEILLELAHSDCALVPCEDYNLLSNHGEILDFTDFAREMYIDPLRVMNRQLRMEHAIRLCDRWNSIVKRNKFIAQVIVETLESDVGVIFLGAYHNKKGKMVDFLRAACKLEVTEINSDIRDQYC